MSARRPKGLKEDEEAPHHLGHRERLRTRFLAARESLPDYELLELVLMQAIPRRDVKPLAKALIDRFDSFAGVIAADHAALVAFDGVKDGTATALKIVHAAAVRLAREEAMAHPVIASWDKLIAYCRTVMGREKTEQFRILFLDVKNKLIRDEVQQTGTVSQTAVYPREVVRRALELGASAFIMVHNHPSGDATPSRADIDMTLEVKKAAEPLGIALHDHVIVTRAGHNSFRALGLL